MNTAAAPCRAGWGFCIYPYLIAAAFPLGMWLHNMAECPTTMQVAATFGLALALAAAAHLGARLLVRDAACRSLLVALLVVGALGYGHAFTLAGGLRLMHRHFLPAWAAVFGLATVAVLLLRNTGLPRRAARLLTVTSPFLIAVQLGSAFPVLRAQLAGVAEASAAAETPATAETEQPDTLPAAQPPDIYYIILDGYARGDVLEQLHGFDNSRFLDALRDRGFYVAEKARSNYAQTQLSLPSSLSMDYLPALPPEDGYELHYRELRRLQKHGRMVRRLRRRGYRFRYVGSIFYPVNDTADEGLFPSGRDGGYLRAFVATTVFDLAFRALEIWNPASDRYAIDRYQLENIARPKQDPAPLVTFAHIVLPHHPYLYDRDGPLPRMVQKEEGTVEHYLEQIRYLNGRVLELIDAIDRTSGPGAVILFQADHGSDFLGMPDEASPEQLFERMSILSAYRVPPEVRERLYPTITPVNSFRVLFAGLFGEELPLLEDRSFYSSYESPLRFVELPRKAVATPRQVQ